MASIRPMLDRMIEVIDGDGSQVFSRGENVAGFHVPACGTFCEDDQRSAIGRQAIVANRG